MGDVQEFEAQKDGVKFKATLEKDKLFVCENDSCLIVDGEEQMFNEVKSLFGSLGFTLNNAVGMVQQA